MGALRFHPIDNDQIIAYRKPPTTARTSSSQSSISIFVTSSPVGCSFPWISFGLDPHQPFQVQDMLTDARYQWQGARNYVELDPSHMPAHIFKIR